MLILKSFFRKKTTKIYYVIYTLIFLCIVLLLFAKDVFRQKNEESHKNCFLVVKNIDNADELKSDIITDIQKIIIADVDNQEIYLLTDSNYDLKENEVVLPSFYKDMVDEEEFNLSINNNTESLLIKDYYDSENMFLLYISKDKYNELELYSNNSFIIRIKEWDKNFANFITYLRNKYDSNNVLGYDDISNKDYSGYIFIVKIFLIVLIILFLVTLIITSINIINDDNEKNY